jgi:hypothetical protein
MFELLAGTQPFDAPSFGELVIQVVTQPARPIGGGVPRGLAAAIARCLERDPAARFQTVGELASAIAPYASDRVAGVSGAQRVATILRNRVQSQPALPIVQLAEASGGATTEMTSNGAVHAISSMSTVAQPSSRRGWIAAGIAIAAVVVIAVVALTTGGGDGAVRPVTSTQPASPPVAFDGGVALAADAAIDAPVPQPVPAAAASSASSASPTSPPPKRRPPVRRTTTPASTEPNDPLGTRL